MSKSKEVYMLSNDEEEGGRMTKVSRVTNAVPPVVLSMLHSSLSLFSRLSPHAILTTTSALLVRSLLS